MCILGYTQTQRDANWTKSMTAAANTGRFRMCEGILFLTLFKFYLVNSFLEFFISLELFNKITGPTFARQTINYYS